MGSLNGTYVNREPVDTASLSSGDEVQIGSSGWSSERSPVRRRGRIVVVSSSAAGHSGQGDQTHVPRTEGTRSGEHSMSIGGGPHAPSGGLSRGVDLEDPLPRIRGPHHPERAPSGYRRFSEADCDRLRFVLTAQRATATRR